MRGRQMLCQRLQQLLLHPHRLTAALQSAAPSVWVHQQQQQQQQHETQPRHPHQLLPCHGHRGVRTGTGMRRQPSRQRQLHRDVEGLDDQLEPPFPPQQVRAAAPTHRLVQLEQQQQQSSWREQWQQQRRQQEDRLQSGHRRAPRQADPTFAPSPAHTPDDTHTSQSSSSSSSNSSRPRQLPGEVRGRAAPRTMRAALDPIRLTVAITAASSLKGLQDIWKQHREQVQQIHVCAAYKAVVRLAVGMGPAQHGTAPATTNSSSSGDSISSMDSAIVSSSSSRDSSIAHDLMRQLSSHMQQHIRVARPWDLAQAAWACSKLRITDAPLLEAIATQVKRKAAVLLPQDIAQLASAYARLGYAQPALLKLLQTQAVAKADDFKPWSLVHTAWALHSCGQGVDHLLLSVVASLKQRQGSLEQLSGLDMSTLLWLMAGHKLRDQALLEAAAVPLAANIGSYPPAAASQALMSCAALGFSTDALSAAACAAVLDGLQQERLSARHAAACTYALARLQACSTEVMAAAGHGFMQQPGAYSPDLLAMLCWACALSGRAAPEGLWTQLLQRSQQLLPQFTADQLASLVRAIFGVPGWQANAPAVAVLDQAHTVLPMKLQGMSTPVLTALIKSLARQHRLAQQQYVSPQLPAGQAAAPDDSSAASSSTASSSTTSSSTASSEQQPQLRSLLVACAAQWLTPARVQEVTQVQAAAVQAALQACQELQLASEVEQVFAARKAAAGQDEAAAQPGPTAAVSSSGRPAVADISGGAVHGSWVDSFVAGTD